jgi:hypothetical protein
MVSGFLCGAQWLFWRSLWCLMVVSKGYVVVNSPLPLATVVNGVSRKETTRFWLWAYLILIQDKNFLIQNKLIPVLFLGWVQPSPLPLVKTIPIQTQH